MSYIVLNNIKATFLTIILLSGFIGITFPPPSSASAELYQNVICDNINLNFNHIEQIQLQNQEDSQTTDNGQQLSTMEGLNLGDSGGPLSNIEDTLTDANINDESLLNLDRNIVTVCINNNDNFLDAESILSINKDWFVCNNKDIDCIVERGEQISFQTPNSGMYTECTSEQDCPFVNDAGFNIGITGNSPIPNTIPAQVNTMQNVDIGAGSFKVSETLFSNELVSESNIDIQNVQVEGLANTYPSLVIAFDAIGQRVFTANADSNSVSIIELNNDNTVTNVPLSPSGGLLPSAIAFDAIGQRVFTANANSDSVSIIDLLESNIVTNVPLSPSGGDRPFSITFDQSGQRVFTGNLDSDSVSIIDLNNDNTVTNVPLSSSGGLAPFSITFDQSGQRVFTANVGSNSVSIIDLNNDNFVTNVDLALPPLRGIAPLSIAFDAIGQRVFTANANSDSVSIIELEDANTVTNVNLAPTGGDDPRVIIFDEAEQKLFTANQGSSSVSIIDLLDSNTVTNVNLASTGGINPLDMIFDETGQRLFTANVGSSSVSIIDLNNDNFVTNLDLTPTGGEDPRAITFDEVDQKVFTANVISDSVSIIDLPTVGKICKGLGFDTGDIRTFESNGQTLQQISCVNFVKECTGNINNDETKECTVQDYVVAVNEISNGEIDILTNSNESQQILKTNDVKQTTNTTSIIPSIPFSFDIRIT